MMQTDMVHLNSNRLRLGSAARSDDLAHIGVRHAAEVLEWLRQCPAHRQTPLLSLPTLADRLSLARVHLKAEWLRMGLGSFKALGGGYAVARAVKQNGQQSPGEPGANHSAVLTVACASAGNHGLAVAAAARVFGVSAIVYISTAVPESFAERLRAQGATVVRSGSNYEESMANIASDAERHGWRLVSDSSWPGYTEVALDVMRGYTVIFDEVVSSMEPATHVFVQAGVGGLAAAAAAYLRERWGDAFQFIVVEPEGAPCLLESARLGRPTRIKGSPTHLGRLDCKEPSLIAFDMLYALADAFMIITDDDAECAAAELTTYGATVSACGAAGAAGLITAYQNEAARRLLQLDSNSQVLIIGTEGPAA